VLIGNLADPGRALVDPSGTVLSPDRRWALEWWVGAEDRWHRAPAEVAVRQSLVAGAPVVETAMRVPGGDIVHRAYASRSGQGGAVIVEVENQTAVPVALALVVRAAPPTGDPDIHLADALGLRGPSMPTAPPGLGAIDLAGSAVWLDGSVGVVFERPPAHASGATELDAIVAVVTSGSAREWGGPVTSESGDACAAFVFPLPHTAVMRASLPVDPAVDGVTAPFPAAVPSATSVAKGWEAQGGRGVRFELPDPRLQDAVDAVRRSLLLAETGDGVVDDDHRDGWVGASAVIGALVELGFVDEAARALATLPEAIGHSGEVGPAGRVDAAGAALVAMGRYLQLTDDRDLMAALAEPAVLVALGLHKRRAPKRRDRRSDRLVVGDRTAPIVGAKPGPTYWDQWWVSAGLRAVGQVFERLGERSAASDAYEDAASVGRAALASARADIGRLGALPVEPGGELDGRTAMNLVAVTLAEAGFLPEEVLVPWADPTRRWLAEHAVGSHGLVAWGPDDGAWVRTAASPLLAQAELGGGDPVGIERLLAAVRAAGPTVAWPELLDPGSGAGGPGRVHDLRVSALFLRAVRAVVLQERNAALWLAPVVPATWWGQGWEVHDAPTRHGLASYAVRWHGERPALLWRVEPWTDCSAGGTGGAALTLRIPGLDPAWSSTELAGETLLRAPLDVFPDASAAPIAGTTSEAHAPGAASDATPPGEGASFG
jgi:hypothetical protein